MEATESAVQHGNHDDPEYDAFLARICARFLALTQNGAVPLFTTDAQGLNDAYLAGFAEGPERQHHNCSACRSFINHFGGLVVIDIDGSTTPAIWNEDDAPALYRPSIARMARLVRAARVNGVFLKSEACWGEPVTGLWRHLHVKPAPTQMHRGTKPTAAQAMAEKREDFKNVQVAMQAFTPPLLETALKLLEADALYRAERVIGPARWLHDLHAARDATTGNARNNVVWRAIALAPAGFCHPRSSMVGTLLEDIEKGLPYADIAKRFAAKMDPMRYQRAVADPSAGQVDAAEQAVEALGIAPAFARRYAVESDFEVPGAVLWRPSQAAARAAAPAAAKSGGVFDHLKPSTAPAGVGVDIPAKKMTLEKFYRDVLPGAASIAYRVPLVGRFCALTSAADPAAAPILQWDSAEVRNSVSWAFPSPPARADEWNLVPGSLAPVRMIVNSPNLWNHAGDRFHSHGRGAFLLLEGARDVRGLPGGGLFTEHLRSELKPYRSTIEAHLNKLAVAGAEDPATVGFGIGLLAGNDWTEAAAPRAPVGGGSAAAAPERIHVILIVDDSGSMQNYIGAARSAMLSLLAAVRAMPGQVDVSVDIFGSQATTLCDRVTLASTEGIERHMRGASGNTALNDTILAAISRGTSWPDAAVASTSFFLGIVTDGEENRSVHSMQAVGEAVARVNATGRWTIAYAGAGRNPRGYASAIGVPEGNTTVFEASARGFDDVGALYASSTVGLAGAYARGARSSTAFFAAASGREAIGTDYPVLVVTTKSGGEAAYALDRWE